MNALPLALVLGVLVVAWDGFCLYDIVRARQVRYLPKVAWGIICLVIFPWGGLAYVVFGRDQGR